MRQPVASPGTDDVMVNVLQNGWDAQRWKKDAEKWEDEVKKIEEHLKDLESEEKRQNIGELGMVAHWNSVNTMLAAWLAWIHTSCRQGQ